jgi:dephospho-CoA kinase
VFAGRPVIGIIGGIGSGKSFIARLFAEIGCLVISSTSRFRRRTVIRPSWARCANWWGEDVIAADGRSTAAASRNASSTIRRSSSGWRT